MALYWVEPSASWGLLKDDRVVCETFDATLAARAASKASEAVGWRVLGIREYLARVGKSGVVTRA